MLPLPNRAIATTTVLTLLSAGLLANTATATPTGWTEIVEHAEMVAPAAQRTLFPQQSATLRYIGLFPTTMQLQRQQDRYQITVTANIPFRKIMLRSSGTLINNQFKPERFEDIRNDQPYAQTIFDHQKQEIRQGKANAAPSITPMPGQAFDPFSLAWQLSLNQGVMAAPFQLATGKGEVQSHRPETLSIERTIRATGRDSIEMAIQLISLPSKKHSRYGLAVDVGYLPAIFGFEDYALTIESITVDGQNYGPNGQALP
ncbi:MAG: hypothetical protein KBC57_13845 [Neisseriaceae bacterium]|nr:hypothetical protein [Neisseriaceae bacterium]MBP6863425.1 hypothetical protein [Neisseriaceae bacterium]